MEIGYSYLTQSELQRYIECPREKIRCIDTETTGLYPEKGDEVLQVAIVDGNGKRLFYELVKPRKRKRWDKAMEIHGIRPAMVKNEKTLDELKPQILKALNGADFIVGYNIGFDVGMLTCRIEDGTVKEDDWFPKSPRYIDAMREYSYVHGEFSSRYGDNKFEPLWKARKHYGIQKTKEHDALCDAVVAMAVFNSLVKDDQYKTAIAEQHARSSNRFNNSVSTGSYEPSHYESSVDASSKREPSVIEGCGCMFILCLIFIITVCLLIQSCNSLFDSLFEL